MRCNKSDITIQIEYDEQQLKSSILKSRTGRNETILVAGIILLIVIAVTLGLFIGLLDPVSHESKQTTKTLYKARQGNWTTLPFKTDIICLYKSYVNI
jgi:hypothetical protein